MRLLLLVRGVIGLDFEPNCSRWQTRKRGSTRIETMHCPPPSSLLVSMRVVYTILDFFCGQRLLTTTGRGSTICYPVMFCASLKLLSPYCLKPNIIRLVNSVICTLTLGSHLMPSFCVPFPGQIFGQFSLNITGGVTLLPMGSTYALCLCLPR